MDISDFTSQILHAVTQELEQLKPKFEHKGLTWRLPEIEVWQSNPTVYTSEMRIDFYRQGDLVDVFEFFIFKDGFPDISEPEIREWIRENSRVMLRRLQVKGC